MSLLDCAAPHCLSSVLQTILGEWYRGVQPLPHCPVCILRRTECLTCHFVCKQAGFWSALPATLAVLKAAVERSRRGVKPQTPATPQVIPFNPSHAVCRLRISACF